MARVTGPVVGELEAAFATDWYCETDAVIDRHTAPETEFEIMRIGDALCQLLPSGPGHEYENNRRLFTELLHAARRRILISTPYFVPDDALLTALTSAALRGVDVTLLNSEIGDQAGVYYAQHSYYERLLKAGIKIYLYPTPILLHSKFMTVDDDLAVIGSSNMDMRSFQLDLEISLICYDRETVARLHVVEEEYLRKSKPIRLAEWRARSTSIKLFENLARLTSSLQ
jgi:cardiolipin synthase